MIVTCKFIIFVGGGHCDYSPQAPNNLSTLPCFFYCLDLSYPIWYFVSSPNSFQRLQFSFIA